MVDLKGVKVSIDPDIGITISPKDGPYTSKLIRSSLICRTGTEDKIRAIYLTDGTKISIKQDDDCGAWMEIGRSSTYDYNSTC